MPQYLVCNYLPDDFDPSTVTEAMIEEIHALNRELIAAGARKFACGISPAANAKTVRKQPDGRVLVTDGPFTETKEHMGGFWILEAADLDQALAWAKKAAITCDASGHRVGPNRANAGCTAIPTTPSRNIDGEALRSDGDSALGRCQHCVRRNDLSELIVQRRHYGPIDLFGAQVTAIEVLVLPGGGCIGYHEDIESQVFCHARRSVDAVFRHHAHDYEGLLLRRA